MVNTQLCTHCAGVGKIMTLDEPPENPQSGEGWEACPHCKGSGVEMAAHPFEVYFVFDDEAEAHAFMERTSATAAARKHGIRAVVDQKSHLGEGPR